MSTYVQPVQGARLYITCTCRVYTRRQVLLSLWRPATGDGRLVLRRIDLFGDWLYWRKNISATTRYFNVRCNVLPCTRYCTTRAGINFDTNFQNLFINWCLTSVANVTWPVLAQRWLQCRIKQAIAPSGQTIWFPPMVVWEDTSVLSGD